MSLNKIESLFDNWCSGISRIGIMGGEPTLHPDCVDICKMASKSYNVIFFTNLLCPQNVLKQLMQINKMTWLINTTTRDEYIDLFDSNLEYINTLENIPAISLGITLTGDFLNDKKFISNLIRVALKFPRVTNIFRISIASPCHDKEYKLKNYDKSIIEFYRQIDKYTPNVRISYDCTVNCCQISSSLLSKILTDSRTWVISSSCNETTIGIMVDGKINNCFSTSEELFKWKVYKDFDNWYECCNYISQIKNNFMKKYKNYCKECSKCQDINCHGACFASTVHLVNQDLKKNIFLRFFKKIKYKFLNRSM